MTERTAETDETGCEHRTGTVSRSMRTLGVVGLVGFVGGIGLTLVTGGRGGGIELGMMLSLLGVVGLAIRGDSGNAIRQLTTKIERFEAGEDVEFTTDRDDAIGTLYEAVRKLAASARATEAQSRQSERYRRRVNDVATDAELSDGEKIERLLELGCERLGQESGYVTEIDGTTGRYEIKQAVGSDVVERESVSDLSEAVCEDAIGSPGLLCIFDATTEGDEGHPAREEWGVGCYLGRTIEDDEVRGTVCFVSEQPRDEPFSPTEKLFADLVSQTISQIFTRQQYVKDRTVRERELEEYKEYTDSILDAIDDVFYVIDSDGMLQRWNDSLSAVTGYEDREIGEMHGTDFFASEHADAVAAAITEVFETGSTRVEAPFLTKDGESIPYEFIASLVEDPDGNAMLVGIGRDISERKRRERELEEINERMEFALDVTDSIIYELDLDTHLEARHGPFERLYGIGSDELPTTEEFYEHGIHPADRGRLKELERLENVTDSDDPLTIEYRTNPTYGDVRWLRAEAHVRTDSDGNPDSIVGLSTDITARKEREQELERTRDMLTQSHKLANIGAWEIDVRDGPPETMSWTDEVFRIHDLQPIADSVSLEAAFRFYHADYEPAVRRAVTAAIEDGRPFEFEARLLTAEGDERWVRAIGEPALDDGEVVRVRGSIQDVTERKRNERELVHRTQELREHKEFTNDILDAIDDVFYVVDENLQLQRWNRSLAEITGYTDEEIPSLHPHELVVEEDEIAVANAIETIFETGTARAEARVLRKDGETIPYEFAGAKVTNPDGNPVLVGIGRDIRERKAYERELERTKDLLEQANRVANIGGWELDVTTDPPTMTWSDQLYQLHGLPSDTEVDLETALEFYHPDDRAAIQDRFERAIEDGESYDMEVRLRTADSDERWVRAIGEPVLDDGDVVRVRGSIQDVTDRKEFELALQSLHEATRGLLGTETERGVADLLVQTAKSDLGLPSVGLFLLDAEANHLRPAAFTDHFASVCEDLGPVTPGAESLLWDCFVTGTPDSFDDSEALAHLGVVDEHVTGGFVVPLGDHGVFVVATPTASISDETQRLVETLVASGEAAFDRIESESALRERDAELEAQNRRLQRQIQITDIIREIDQSLITANSREEIEAAVCDRLVDSEDAVFAWIGSTSTGGDRLEPRVWAGTGGEYLDAVSLATDASEPEPAVATAATQTPTVVSNVLADLERGTWCEDALTCDFHSVLSVPLTYEEYFYGVLTVYAAEPGAFDDLERVVFAELGENIAHSINAVETRRALHADTLAELTLEGDPDDDILGRVAAAAGCSVTYEGLASVSENRGRLFFTTRNTDPESVSAVLEGLVAVEDFRLVTERGDDDSAETLFEVTVTGDVLISRLVRHGGSPQSITATPESLTVVVDLPMATDVREFVEMLQGASPSIELAGRRTIQRTAHTKQEVVVSLLEELTERQREVLRTAYYAGFFEWPRASTGEDVAAMLGVTQPTVNRHLRLAQQRLLSQLFETNDGDGVTGAA